MPTFVYNGPGNSLSLAGRTLARGIPTILEGRAAEAASLHPDVSASRPAAGSVSKPSSGLGEYALLQARARELGLPASGKKGELAEAIKAEEKRLADEAAAAAGSGAD